ncbi:MAG: nuclear transport factor 2 family protein [Pyrinomonadaceae bacterium]
MKRNLFILVTLTIASLCMACGESGANSAGSKPANSAAGNANVAAPVNPAAIEADIKKMMTDVAGALAKNDADAVEKFYADNYMLVNVDGSVQTRAERLAALRSGDVKYSSFAYSDSQVRVNPEGTGAVAITKATFKAVNKGKPLDGDFRVTHVWSKMKDGSWKMVNAQATKIEGGDAAKTDDKPKADDKSKLANAAKADTMAGDDIEPPKKK